MKDSLQDILLYIPLHQLSFLTPLPKEPVYYEAISDHIPDRSLERPTLLIIENEAECGRLNEESIINQLIQDRCLIGLVLCLQNKNNIPIRDETFSIYQKCQFPIIHVVNPSSLHVFHLDKKPLYSYSQLSLELNGFMEAGFTGLASDLAKTFGTPILFLDENDQLLWQTGQEKDLQLAHQWLNVHRNDLEKDIYANIYTKEETITTAMEPTNSFELYSINIAGIITQTLVVSAALVDWQKMLVDKLVGLTALLLQTENMFQDQQEKFKEHFLYDLLYHKFDSHKVMINQAKAWGWNLERPHHLFIINIELIGELTTNLDWFAEVFTHIDIQSSKMEERIFVFPFQDQIVVFIEDSKDRTINERKRYVREIAYQLKGDLSSRWSQCQFYIGIGKWYQDSTFLNKSYQEAKLALQFGQSWFENKKIFHINDLGILRLLIHIHQEILFDFSQEYLSLLIECDHDNGTEYIKTLKVYIQHQGIINEVSDALFVHPNTLRNRIKKIEEITGINLQDPEEFMNLMIALKIQSFINL